MNNSERSVAFLAMFAAFLSVSVLAVAFALLIRRRSSNLKSPFSLSSNLGGSPSLSFGTLLRWSTDLDVSMTQVNQSYKWRIEQWAAFSTAVLTATLTFVSTAIVAWLKNEIQREGEPMAVLILLGVATSLALYLFCQRSIARLRREFIALYDLVLRLR